ncbi:sugar phosphate isomerase/epimerase [Ponticoccus sp. SC2-23]|uniref:sugar phosphate isomerase/epimerase family protein n=1 Tax=Alexandriicola marinus TaxID=2081710 RepID=UPI000FDA1A2C|nr:sugar phosphate isomerase/epimerase family protein [Alexandriicola marinus]MBM1221270.1 sugar phosphate isomerase/epimerase [Ponticoccus sp. SC6-9]MBM1225840.1 sugar phosphate isomerase/epimerase [Ponticoccus sp. SC6-15]MBM1227992.1 sugar phosphate isomerase/epimerase [Ponticoccus sp. SC6-38]MBM1234370.1 sugar phosphate isomerase/epimerase [Ponticoccus sp. SC6-45]MBM1238494.1 sugar phosphate isomerase/epimerase [Ponticoccus sp. SC6-49]MBM1243763.1 sugar phosphate isomerase/epimerase [Ponti
MKFGIHAGLWMKAWTDDPAPIFTIASDIGYDGVELSLLGIGLDRADEIRAQAQACGLELTCSTGLGPEADPTSDDPAIRDNAVAVLTDAIRVTARLGAGGLAGVVAAPWGVFDPANKAARAARSAETLARLDGVLASEGVTLGIEALNRFETDLTSTAAETCAIARACGSDHIGVLLDAFHMNIEEKDPPAAIRAAGDTLVHYHVSENDRGRPGSGRYDFPADARALADIGYDRWVVAEMFVMAGHASSRDLNIWRDIEPDPTEAATKTLAYLRETFGHVG